MRTKNTAAYAIVKQEIGGSGETLTLVLDKTGAAMTDTNKARLDAKLELLQSISDDFEGCVVTPVTLKQIAL